jgi:hypothetical protein
VSLSKYLIRVDTQATPPGALNVTDVEDPLVAVRAWEERMVARYGPRVWDQEQHEWLSWQAALSRHIFGPNHRWLLDTFVWSEQDYHNAITWETSNWWPSWAVKAHLVDRVPCDYGDHEWKLVVDQGDLKLTCVDPCDDPRVFCDAGGRYVLPACQNPPTTELLSFEATVQPKFVHDGDLLWVELTQDSS